MPLFNIVINLVRILYQTTCPATTVTYHLLSTDTGYAFRENRGLIKQRIRNFIKNSNENEVNVKL
jgi:hypothetical protein